ncbi:hypothetical protein LINGRAHAP2_LOCUS32630 [Linum grandiflorum]
MENQISRSFLIFLFYFFHAINCMLFGFHSSFLSSSYMVADCREIVLQNNQTSILPSAIHHYGWI